LSKSAVSVTIVGFFPPNSAIIGLGFIVEESLKILYPTSLEPVKTIPEIFLLLTIILPMVAASPVM
jgi:hypothetical protein